MQISQIVFFNTIDIKAAWDFDYMVKASGGSPMHGLRSRISSYVLCHIAVNIGENVRVRSEDIL